MSNHTPGPYRKSPPLDRPRLIAGVEIGSDHGIVAYVYGTTDAECVANAYLLNAAPRMKAAIEKVLDWNTCTRLHLSLKARVELRAALAEAEGGE